MNIAYTLPESISQQNLAAVKADIEKYFANLGELTPELRKQKSIFYRKAASRARWSDPKVRAKQSEKLKEVQSRPEIKLQHKLTWSDPEVLARHQKATKEARNRPEVVEQQRQTLLQTYRDHPEVIKQISKTTKTNWQNEEIRQRTLDGFTEDVKTFLAENTRKSWESDTVRAQRSEGIKLSWQDPVSRALRLENQRKVMTSQAYREKMSSLLKLAMTNPLTRQAISQASSLHWKDKEYRTKTILAMHRAWQDPQIKNNWYLSFRQAQRKFHVFYEDLLFDSSWEVEVYKKLKALSIEVIYAPERIELEEFSWLPDFYLPSIDSYLEVKGHPKAVEKWINKILPALKTKNLSILVLWSENYSQLSSITTLDDLINLCEKVS